MLTYDIVFISITGQMKMAKALSTTNKSKSLKEI